MFVRPNFFQKQKHSPNVAKSSNGGSKACTASNVNSLPKAATVRKPSNTMIKSVSDKSLSGFESISPNLLAARHLRTLTQPQKVALLNTWKQIKDSNGTKLMERIFQRLTSENPTIKDLFYKVVFLTMLSNHNSTITTCRDHANVLFKILDDLITNIDDCNTILLSIREMGKKHSFLKKSGFKLELWEKFGEVAVEVIIGQSFIRSNTDATRSWTVVLACVTDELCYGYKKQCRSDMFVNANWHSVE